MDHTPSSTHSPERQSSLTPEQALDPQRIEALREKQWQQIADAIRENPGANRESVKRQYMADGYQKSIDDHLEQSGITQDDPRYTEYRDVVRAYSINPLDSDVMTFGDDWRRPRPDGQTFQEKYQARYNTLFNIDQTPTPAPNTTTPQVERDRNLEQNLENAARAKHAAFAEKVSGPAFGKERKAELQANYDQAEAAYLLALRQQIESELAANGYIGDQMEDYMVEQVNIRAQIDDDEQHRLLVANGGKKAELLARYANLSTGKKIGVTLFMGGAAAGLGLAIGALGAVPATVAALSLGVRFGRGYGNQLSKIYKKNEVAPTFEESEYDDVYEFLSGTSQEKIKKAEKIKQRAVVIAVGSVAAGSALGMYAHTAYDHIRDITEDNSHWAGGFIQHHFGLNRPDIDVTVPRPPEVTVPPVIPTPDIETPDIITPDKDEAPAWRYGADEIRISSGEGFYSMFNDMGVSTSERAELLRAVGPRLEDRGLAYRENGEWRMNMTDNGKFPKSAIRMIAEEAHDRGIHTDYEKFIEGAADANVSSQTESVAEIAEGRDEATIARGEGGFEFAREIGVSNAADQATVWEATAPDLDKDLTYFDKTHDEWRINMTPDGAMPTEAIEAMAENAHEEGIKTDYSEVFDHQIGGDADTSGIEISSQAPNGEFMVSDLKGKAIDADAKAYAQVLKGVDRDHWGALLSAAAPQLSTIQPDGIPLAYNTGGVWHFRQIDKLPQGAAKLLSDMAKQKHWTLTA